jgi:hypothetical protein
MQISDNDLQSFYTLLTPRIKADLSAWYGNEARLVGEPTFHPRPWSYFFRYRVQINGSKEQAVLAKIRHIENMSISEAVQDEKMRAEMQDEFDSLVKIRNVFSHAADAERFATIRQLALYKDLNTLMMEEADIHTLKSRFQKPAMWVEGSARKVFESHLELTGHWLRTFHDQIGDAQTGPFFSEALYQKTQANLQRIQAGSGKNLIFLQSLLDSLYNQHRDRTLPYRMTHDNYSLANVFVTGDEKICSFDPHNKPGSMYLDIAKLITDMQTCAIQVSTSGLSVPPSRLAKFNAAFLSGYFRSEPVDVSALNLYCLILLIEKWAETEEKVVEATGARKLAYALASIPMRSYFLRLIRRQMQNHEN